MTEKEFFKQAEFELHESKSVSSSTCQSWTDLSTESRAVLAPAMAFLGCSPDGTETFDSQETKRAHRVAAIRLMLVKLGLDGGDPRWSSDMLNRLLQKVVNTPGGSLDDLFLAVYYVLGDYSSPLSATMARLLKELVISSFTQYRSSYDTVDWEPFVQKMANEPTESQLYFSLHAVPPQYLSTDLAETIAKKLADTPYREEARNVLAVA